MIRKGVIGLALFALSFEAIGACTGQVKIKELYSRSGGWVHVVAENVSDIDLANCGHHNSTALVLNYTDSHGTLEGKKILYSAILAAFTAGKTLRLCSDACDSRFSSYSTLTDIDGMR
ncbi:hypothetical protein sS8_1841 [Methylocaldum marinum]|uniref:Lipoprotein n=1 Tax=Methylocaldum marinum TaxID=1432792 RepID=A0A250KQ55_9GAMM|nr:hypothetical protein [Methylocaldum marinum]BBA33795.1 hypothetical protein sS8_1841 [Methylocaldum marinum]